MRFRTLSIWAIATAALCIAPVYLQAQREGAVMTQVLVAVDSKTNVAPTSAQVTVKVDGKETPILGWQRAQAVRGGGVQVAILMDDGLRESVGKQIDDLRAWVANLPAEMQVYIGYMRNGTVVTVQDFTTDHATAATKVRLPNGVPGVSASPYFCLSTFVNQWPSATSAARFVLMLTNGVDPYNGSVSPLNQDSPNVDRAQIDAQRAGVAVYSIYYADAGLAMRTEAASDSGQNYLTQVASATGGVAYSEGTRSPISLIPYLHYFQSAIAETYVASFTANAGHNRPVGVKFSTNAAKTKLNAPSTVMPGNMEGPRQ